MPDGLSGINPGVPHIEDGFLMDYIGNDPTDAAGVATPLITRFDGNGTNGFAWCSCQDLVFSFTRLDGGPFSAASFDGGNVIPVEFSPGMAISIDGVRLDGSTTSQTFELIENIYTTFLFDATFTGLVQLTLLSAVGQVPADFLMDNIVLRAIQCDEHHYTRR